MNDWKDPKKEYPTLEKEVEVIYKSPLNDLKYMGIAIYKGNNKWFINGEFFSTDNIISWSPIVTMYYR